MLCVQILILYKKKISKCYSKFQLKGKVSNEQTRSTEYSIYWLILKQTFPANIIEILAVWINRNYFLKSITMFKLIERICCWLCKMGRVKWIWYLSPMPAAKVQVSLRIRTVSQEPPLLAHTSSESRGTFRQKVRSIAPLNGWACAVKICHDGMLEDTNSLDGAQIMFGVQIIRVFELLQGLP